MKKTYEVVALTTGNRKFYVQGSNVDAIKQYANQLKIKYDDITAIPQLSARNGIFKIWGIGELADHLKEDADELQS